MKKSIILIALIIASFSSYSQTISPSGSTGNRFPVYGFVQTYPTTDTTVWYWNRTQTSVIINDTILSRMQIPAIYSYSVTPLNHVSAPVYSICVTKDTGLYIKVLGTDSAGWYKAR